MDKKNNTGEENTGDRNSGYWNSGNRNSGYWNSGDRNSGYRNSGDRNSGYWNSGDRNSGNGNSGNGNSGNRNSGDFNTNEPKMRLFNKDLDMTVLEFRKKYSIYMNIPLNRWIDKSEMSDEEKKDVNGWEEMDGYLKTLPYKEACQVWWNENPNEHKRFLELPNFSQSLFLEITGIDVGCDKDEDIIELNGKRYKEIDS